MEGKELAKLDGLETMDMVVKECMPIQMKDTLLPSESFQMADAILTLQKIFDREDVKERVMAMKDTRLGFITDRSDEALKRNRKLVPYEYSTIRDACVEALISGYRMTGNEFNLIASNFYAAKNGKLRRIREYPGVTDFQFTTTTPKYESEKRVAYDKPINVQFALVQCWASWNKDGTAVRLGYSENGKEDKLIFKIKVNNAMGDDAITGKALSKLFTRVLIRLGGQLSPGEFGEPDPENTINVTPENDVKPAGVRTDADINADTNALLDKPYADQDSDERLVSGMLKRAPKQFRAFLVDDGHIYMGLKKHRPELYQLLVDRWGAYFPNEPFPFAHKKEQFDDGDFPPREAAGPGTSESEEEKPDPWTDFRSDWIHIKTSGSFTVYVNKNLGLFGQCKIEAPEIYQEGIDKWKRLECKGPWPLTEQDQEDAHRDELRMEAAKIPDHEAGTTMDDEVSECRRLLQEWRIKEPEIFKTVVEMLGYNAKELNVEQLDITLCNDITHRLVIAYQRKEKDRKGPPA